MVLVAIVSHSLLCNCVCGSITDDLLTSGALNQCCELVKLNLNRTNISDKGL